MLQQIEFVSGCSKGPVVIAVAVWLRCYILVTIIRMSPDIIHTRLLMRDTVVENLILDLLEWLALRDRSYEEVMEAWRTSCPKLPVWEEANDRGLVTGVEGKGCTVIRPTAAGISLLHEQRPKQTEASTAV